MINPRDHEIISPDLAGYALDALEDDVCRRVEAHLAECENCTSELEELMEGATGLAFAVPTVMPPPDYRSESARLSTQTPHSPPGNNQRARGGRLLS